MRRGTAPTVRGAAALAALVGSVLAGPAHGAVQTEQAVLEKVAALEARGAYDPADTLLRALLCRNPVSLSGLLGFERIASLRGHAEDILPVVDTLLSLDPGSTIAHQVRIRALSRLNLEPQLDSAAASWIDAMPAIETPYRELARMWRSRGAFEKAVHTLERGRSRIRRPDALALELGDAWAELGEPQAVAREWARAIGPHGEAFLLVRRRLASLPDAGASVIPGLVDALVGEPAMPARMKAAVQLAIDAGLDDRAGSIADRLLSRLPGPDRATFLVEVGRRADGAGLRRLALWAYGRIVAEGAELDPMLPVRTRVAELALSLGDTARAAAVYREVEDQLEPGSPERRQAMSLRIQMLARQGTFDDAIAQLTQLVDEPGSGTESDLAAAVLANALVDAGRATDAGQVLAGIDGPHVSLARGRVLMTLGNVRRARAQIIAAAPLLSGPEATEAIRLASLLGRLSDSGGALVGRGLASMSAGDGRVGVMLLYSGSERLVDAERAAILDFTANLADRIGLVAEADQVRRDIVTELPGSPEAPAALLTLARRRIDRESPAEARVLLEQLVFEYPRSALAPQARRELERLAARNRQP